MVSRMSGAKMMCWTKRRDGDAFGQVAECGGDAPAQDDQQHAAIRKTLR